MDRGKQCSPNTNKRKYNLHDSLSLFLEVAQLLEKLCLFTCFGSGREQAHLSDLILAELNWGEEIGKPSVWDPSVLSPLADDTAYTNFPTHLHPTQTTRPGTKY